MAESILGLLSSGKFAAESDYFYNHRRQILHEYPKGGAPLTGLMSMMPSEETNSFNFLWHEKRWETPVTDTRGTDPLTSTAPSTGDADEGTEVTSTLAVGTSYYLKVDTTEDMRPGLVIQIDDTLQWQFRVEAVTRGVSSALLLGYLTVRPIRAISYTDEDVVADQKVRVIGSAFGEGQSGVGVTGSRFKRPYVVQNVTEIFRTPFDFSGSVIQQGLKWDKSGPYKERAKDAVVEHMTGLERSIIFGKRSSGDRPSFDSTQEALTTRTMSGILEFLTLWDAGATGISVDGSTYAPYPYTAATSDTDDRKRIITNSGGTISYKKFMQWAERVSRYHASAKTNERLVLCGSGAVIAVNEMLRLNSSFNVTTGHSVYGLSITTVTTPFGDYHFMTHPLFNEQAAYRNWMLIIDVWSLKYRPLINRDTKLLKNRQNNGDDFRRDEYLTEAGLEFCFPGNNMLIQNVTSYVES